MSFKNQAASCCFCLCCGYVGNAFALSKRSGISTALAAASISSMPARHTAIGIMLFIAWCGRRRLSRPWGGVAQGQRRSREPRPVEGDVGDRDLPDLGARRPCRALRGLRPYARRLQFLSQPPLPEVSSCGGAAMARRARGRASAGSLLSRRLHPAGGDRRDRIPEQGRRLRPPDARRRRVHPPLPPPCAAERLQLHPPLRLLRQSLEKTRPRPTSGRGEPQPNLTRTRWTAPSSTMRSRKGRSTISTPSISAKPTPRQTPAGLSTVISYRADCRRTVISYVAQLFGIQGSRCKKAPRMRSPRMLSTPARCIQPAEPVYHVQPPRPMWGALA